MLALFCVAIWLLLIAALLIEDMAAGDEEHEGERLNVAMGLKLRWKMCWCAGINAGLPPDEVAWADVVDVVGPVCPPLVVVIAVIAVIDVVVVVVVAATVFVRLWFNCRIELKENISKQWNTQ